jgi:hypothetical protein
VTEAELPPFLWEITRQLRRRRLPLGVEDYDALRRALSAGFGLDSSDSLRRLCVALWAKSAEEAEIVQAAFVRNDVPEWEAALPEDPAEATTAEPDLQLGTPSAAVDVAQAEEAGASPGAPQARPISDFTAAPPATGAVDKSLVLVGQYPLTEREIAQTWRRLRRPLRVGPAVEIDVAATIEQRTRHAVATPPVLVPRRRNTAKLLLLIDRYGSMTPFHSYVAHVVRAIRRAGRIDDVREVFFHDLPGRSADHALLDALDDPFRPDLDPILPLIGPLEDGRVYEDAELTAPLALAKVLEEMADDTAAVVISDAGAARGQFDAMRLLDTIALLRALYARADAVAWINPVRADDWPRSTAGQVARSVPMYPLSRDGLSRAVDTLRGRPAKVERSL